MLRSSVYAHCIDVERRNADWPLVLRCAALQQRPRDHHNGVTAVVSHGQRQQALSETIPAPTDPRIGEFLSWLMFVATGIGPFLGQDAHFEHFSPEKVPSAQKRYKFKAERHLKVVDMGLWGWTQLLWFIVGKGTLSRFRNFKRHHDETAARPAAKIASGLRGRHSFKMEVDDEMRGFMFRRLAS